ncbi:MAG: two-component regulator propeller domain-containing protein, partial [Ferruginibacter sp.]
MRTVDHMINKRIILFNFCLLGLAFLATSQQKQINFTSLTTEDGLSSNNVNTILKDRYGLVWFATDDGLDKFDGTRFSVYRHKPGDSASLQSNEILSLHEDKKGNLWVGTSGGSLSLYNRKKDCFSHYASKESPNSIRNNVIRAIYCDYKGDIWIAHFDGIDILDPQTKTLIPIPFITKNSSASHPTHGKCLFEDSRKQMWIGTNQGLYKYSPGTKSFTLFTHVNADSLSLSGNIINAIIEDNKGNIWIGTKEGLSTIRPGANSFKNFRHIDKAPTTLSSSEINAVAADGDNLWIGTTDGLNIMNTKSGEITKFGLDHRNIHSLSAKAVRCIYIDKQGIYWLGTISGGVDKYDKNLNLFNYVKSNVFDENGLNASIVTSFAEAEKGKVFIGTEGKGVSLFSPDTKLFQHFNLLSQRNGVGDRLSVLALQMTFKKQLLIGTSVDGLFALNPVSGKYSQYLQGTGAEDLNSNEIYSISKFSDGSIWIGSNGEGINVLNTDLKVIKRYTPNPKTSKDIKLPINGYIRDIKEDKDGDVWVGTHGGGIAVLQPSTGKFTIYNTSNSKLPNDKVLSILEDSRGQIWAGTFGGGLALFNKKNNQFSVFSEKEGLQNSTIYKVVEDKAGLIWVSTNKGISSIDPSTKNINNFNFHNGLQNNNFFHGSGIMLADGELFFGGLDGFNYFHPDYLIKNKNIPPVLLTDLRISNQSVNPSEHGPIQEHISIAKEINLDYKQNFALDFVGLSYTTPELNRYKYKLGGYEKEWNTVGNLTTATFTNLDPGDYVFEIRASNNDGVWNEKGASIKVHVHPPIWRTMYAYIFYVLLLIGSLLYLRHLGIRKIKKKFTLDQEKIYAAQERREAERIHELDRVKIKFLTNLSHEFRTPISLILGPANSLLLEEKNPHSFRQLDIIKRNARRL